MQPPRVEAQRYRDPNWPISINLDAHQGQFIPEAKPKQPLGRAREGEGGGEPQLPPTPLYPTTWDPNKSRSDEVGTRVDGVGWGDVSFSCRVSGQNDNRMNPRLHRTISSSAGLPGLQQGRWIDGALQEQPTSRTPLLLRQYKVFRTSHGGRAEPADSFSSSHSGLVEPGWSLISWVQPGWSWGGPCWVWSCPVRIKLFSTVQLYRRTLKKMHHFD